MTHLTRADLNALKCRVSTAHHRLLLHAINDQDGHPVSLARLAEDTGTTTEYVRKSLRQLRALGLVSFGHRTGRAITYTLLGTYQDRTPGGTVRPYPEEATQTALFSGQFISRPYPRGTVRPYPSGPPGITQGTQGSKKKKNQGTRDPGADPIPTYGLGVPPAGDWARDGWKRERLRRAHQAEGRPRDDDAGTDPMALGSILPDVLARIRERVAVAGAA